MENNEPPLEPPLEVSFLQITKLMITQPGAMSHQYAADKQIKFIKPVIIFLIVNVIFFLLGYGDSLSTKLYPQMNNILYHSGVATNIVEKKIKEEHLSLKTFVVKYEARSGSIGKIFLFIVVLGFSIPLWIVNFRKRILFQGHLMASLEFISLITIYAFVFLSWLPVSKYLLILTACVLLYLFERNTYKETIFRSLSKAALLVVLFFITLYVYRISLFYITMWTL